MKSTLKVLFSTLVLTTGCAVTPQPFSPDELRAQSADRVERYIANQEVVDKPISLYDAMARAIKYNLDYKVELMERSLRVSELDLTRFDQLPDLVASAGYNSRNNFSGSRSSELLSSSSVGGQSLVPSTSSERDVFDADLTLSWDVLDFGLSYVRAEQKADEVLIAEERKRKVINRIIEDVRTAYWRAVSAERLISQLSVLETDITKALADSDKIYQRRKTPPLAALTYQRELLKIQQDIQNLQQDLVVAKRQLAALMNIDPGSDYALVLPDRSEAVVDIRANPEQMIKTALLNRSELREISYQQRINEKEGTAELLKLLPSLRLFGGFNYNSNDFLFSNDWRSIAAQTSWNLLDVFSYSAKKRRGEATKQLLDQRALATTMAVMTQVHVSLSRFEIAKRRLATTRQYHTVQSEILTQTVATHQSSRGSKQNLIRERMNEIVSEAKYDLALADLQNAFANIYASMGLDPFGATARSDDSVSELSKHLKQHWSTRTSKVGVSKKPANKVASVNKG